MLVEISVPCELPVDIATWKSGLRLPCSKTDLMENAGC